MPQEVRRKGGFALTAEVAFGVLLALVLGTHADSLRTGPFTWLQLYRVSLPSDTIVVGVLALLPVVWLAAWVATRLRTERFWRWGHRALTLPLAVLSVWAALDLSPGVSASGLKALLSLWILWLIYLFVVNERPRLLVPFLIVIILQSIVGIGQVWKQSDLGLRFLGEYRLDPGAAGVLVIAVNGVRWLRAYGLAGGPNALGATLALLLVMVMPVMIRAQGWRLWALSGVLSLGTLGLMATYSRSALLSLTLGLMTWGGLVFWRRRRISWNWQQGVAILMPFVVGITFLLANRLLVQTRLLVFDNPLEARSIAERQRDFDVTAQLLETSPIRGVGFGNISAAVKAVDPGADVIHSAPLLVAAELGLVGAVLWTWFVLMGLWRGYRNSPWHLALWVTALVPSLFGPWWITVSWRATIMLAIVAAMSACEPPYQIDRVVRDAG